MFKDPAGPWTVLLATIPAAVLSGSLFVFSVYSTELAEHCGLPSSAIANLNISSTIGASIGGLLSGVVTDRFGTQLPVLCSFFFITAGYTWLRSLFLAGPAAQSWMLLAAMFLIGVGSVSSYFAALKAVTVSFPRYKGSAQSVTIAAFAISSFIYSFVYSVVLHGDVSAFLLFLAASSALMQFIGVLFIRVRGHQAQPELQPLLGEVNDEVFHLKHLSLQETLANPILWVHFFLMAIVQGLGQMYIYTVGYVTKALHYHYVHAGPNPQLVPSLHSLQALQVSLIALFSFLGRVASGPMTDTLVNRFKFQRHWVTAFGVVILFCGHVILSLPFDAWSSDFATINRVLSLASCCLGFAYGLSFTTFPAIISDIFSLKFYTLLWGIMYCSTLPGLTFFTKIFGYIYDKNSTFEGDEYVCTKGSYCYKTTFDVTSTMALMVLMAIMLYIYHRRR